MDRRVVGTHVGLSRAALARRFAVQMGEPPLTYLTRWRLALAADLLVSTDLTLAAIAVQGRVRERVRSQRGLQAGPRRVASGLSTPRRDGVGVLAVKGAGCPGRRGSSPAGRVDEQPEDVRSVVVTGRVEQPASDGTSARSSSATSVLLSRSGPASTHLRSDDDGVPRLHPGAVLVAVRGGHEPVAVGEVRRDLIDVQDGLTPMTYSGSPGRCAAVSGSSHRPRPASARARHRCPGRRGGTGRGACSSPSRSAHRSGRAGVHRPQRRSVAHAPDRAFDRWA